MRAVVPGAARRLSVVALIATSKPLRVADTLAVLEAAWVVADDLHPIDRPIPELAVVGCQADHSRQPEEAAIASRETDGDCA